MNRLDEAQRGAVLAAVDDAFAEQLRFTAELVRSPSTRGEEAPAQDVMANAMARRGLEVDRWRLRVEDLQDLPGFSPVTISYERSFNVVGVRRARSLRGRSLIFNGHIDVVPPGRREGWTHPPFEPVIVDGWMHGRGAGDMKAGLAAPLFALDALSRAGLAPTADVTVQSVVEEECTGNGALACLQRGYRADLAFVPEPTALRLMRAQLSPMWFRVEIAGAPSHLSQAFGSAGENAIERVFPLLQALKALEAEWNARKAEIPAFRDHPHPINFNIGRIAGGDWPSSVPDWCWFDMRVAVYPGDSLSEARREIEARISAAAAQDAYLRRHPPRIVYHGLQAEGYVLKNAAEAEQTLSHAHGAATGTELSEFSLAATTDARFFGLYGGMPALVYGPEARAAHAYDEAVNLPSLNHFTKTMALFIADWCGFEVV